VLQACIHAYGLENSQSGRGKAELEAEQPMRVELNSTVTDLRDRTQMERQQQLLSCGAAREKELAVITHNGCV